MKHVSSSSSSLAVLPTNMEVVEENAACQWIDLIHKFLDKFGWFADSFVLNFYEENHWNRVPYSWQKFLTTMKPEELGDLLDFNVQNGWDASLKRREIPPLGLLSLRSTVKLLSLNRQKQTLRPTDCSNAPNDHQGDCADSVVDEFKNLFTRHVKPKKRHEVLESCKIVSKLSNESSTKHVFDVGAGLGHFSRYLTYGCSLNLTCIDCVGKLGESASKFDSELELFLAQRKFIASSRPPTHVCVQLELNKHEKELQRQENFGIVGLHSCGALSPVIIHNFVNSPAKFMVSVGCCYQKLDTNSYPLSEYCKGKRSKFGLGKLTYEALEVASHAIEQYCQKLRDGQVSKLMTHVYRATLETVLVRKFGIQRAGLRGVAGCEKMSFSEYAIKAIKNLGINLSEDLLHNENIKKMLKDWYTLVVFFSLRLLIANVVETLVIMDRALFIKENVNASVTIVALFDPIISPRNLAIVSERI